MTKSFLLGSLFFFLMATAQCTNPSEFVQDRLRAHKVQIFSKSYCPYCKNVKSLFTQLKVSYHVDELDQMDNGDEIQQELLRRTGQRTVPNVFIDGNHLGGFDDTSRAKESGLLRNLLSNAGVSFGEEL